MDSDVILTAVNAAESVTNVPRKPERSSYRARKTMEGAIHLIFLLCGIVAVAFVLFISIYLILSGLPAIRQIGLVQFLFGKQILAVYQRFCTGIKREKRQHQKQSRFPEPAQTGCPEQVHADGNEENQNGRPQQRAEANCRTAAEGKRDFPPGVCLLLRTNIEIERQNGKRKRKGIEIKKRDIGIKRGKDHAEQRRKERHAVAE